MVTPIPGSLIEFDQYLLLIKALEKYMYFSDVCCSLYIVLVNSTF